MSELMSESMSESADWMTMLTRGGEVVADAFVFGAETTMSAHMRDALKIAGVTEWRAAQVKAFLEKFAHAAPESFENKDLVFCVKGVEKQLNAVDWYNCVRANWHHGGRGLSRDEQARLQGLPWWEQPTKEGSRDDQPPKTRGGWQWSAAAKAEAKYRSYMKRHGCVPPKVDFKWLKKRQLLREEAVLERARRRSLQSLARKRKPEAARTAAPVAAQRRLNWTVRAL